MPRLKKESGGAKRPKALILSDVMLFREGLRDYLERIGDLEITGTTTPNEALRFVARTRVDIVIIDASRQRALSHIAGLRGAQPGVKVIAFAVCSEAAMLAGAEVGIRAFVGKNGNVSEINLAALMALREESYCSPADTARLIDYISSLASQITKPINGLLTTRECEVASMVGKGLSNKEIAQKLCISPATVKNHVHNILEKSSLPNRSAIGGQLQNRLTKPQPEKGNTLIFDHLWRS